MILKLLPQGIKETSKKLCAKLEGTVRNFKLLTLTKGARIKWLKFAPSGRDQN